MSVITLYLPGLFGPWPTIYRPQLKAFLNDNPTTAAALQQLISGKSSSPCGNFHEALYQQLTPEAPYCYAHDRWRSEPSFQADQAFPAFCADPVSMQAEMHGARVFDSELLAISKQQAEQLNSDFNKIFAEDGYHWHLLGNRGYLFVDHTVDVQTLALGEATEADLLEWGFTGRDSSRFQKFATEWQMWLYQHPINVEKRAKKELPISAIWLWGEGLSNQHSTPYRALYQNDAEPLTVGLCDRLGLPIQPLTSTVPNQAPPGSIIIDDRLLHYANALEWDGWLHELSMVCDSLITPLHDRIGKPYTLTVPGIAKLTPVSGMARMAQWFSRSDQQTFVEWMQWR